MTDTATTEALATDLDAFKLDLEERGYVILRDLVSREHADAAARLLIELGEWDDPQILNRLDPASYGVVLPLLVHPVVLALAEHMLGPGYKLSGDPGRLGGAPGEAAQPLHSDVPYSWFAQNRRPWPNDCAVVNTIWALTEFTPENGATELVPFTHALGYAPRTPWGTGHDEEHRYDDDTRSAAMSPGSVLVFHGALWHRRGANTTTDQRRIGMSVPYIANWLDPVTAGWILLRRSVRDRLPEALQRLNPHVDEG